jgi:hypothetical protein
MQPVVVDDGGIHRFRDGCPLGVCTTYVGPTYVEVHVPREVFDEVLALVNGAVARRQEARQVSRSKTGDGERE